MSTPTYDLGDLVRVHTNDGPFSNAATGAALDPDVVSVSIRDPDGTVTTYVYGTDDEVVKDGTGSYHMDVDADTAGVWFYRWFSTGDGQAAEERSFIVRPAEAI